ncbi:MAG: primosomal protein N' [Candidatus Azobacteroides sp.]|nr:primosomal protein N' [Candidatus Azobacteroides sp.]
MTHTPINYADVILPLPLAEYYTYQIPETMLPHVKPGCRVIVSFGKKKFYTAIIARIHQTAPEAYETKEIAGILDEKPVIKPEQLELWKWIASYYQCTLGEVYKAALPAALKLESETTVTINPSFTTSEKKITEKEQRILDVFSSKNKMTLSELERFSGIKNVLPIVKSLLEKEALLLNEELRNNYKAKTETYIRLTEKYASEAAISRLLNESARTQKQQAVIMYFLKVSGYLSGKPEEVPKKTISKNPDLSPSALNGLIKKGIFEIYTKKTDRLQRFHGHMSRINSLNPLQQEAYDEIKKSFKDKNITLLHGVTSSGKTEIYIHLIAETLKQGKQVLYLVPEIALTTQITERISQVFGDKFCVYHSKFSNNERVEIWNKLLDDKGYDIILGARSAVFLPFRELGLVIVDEEHENTYKQFDPAPRYHAKNTAMVLAEMHHAKTLLGTATPSLESYYFAKTGKYGLVEMFKRFEEIEMPHIEVIDTKILFRRKQMISHFSPFLLEKMAEALTAGEQVILFQNRRGFAPMVECKLCSWIPKCRNCDVSLTYHKRFRQMTCHYCGYAENVPEICPACGNPTLVTRGFGTEKIEEEIAEIFPGAHIARMDLDTAKTRGSYERIIRDFQALRTNILIGTQMVSKGLDFAHVSVVGILNADVMINYPDFRSYERAYQLMAQVAGRAGRKNKRGLVVLQTGKPEHSIMQYIKNNDYEGMFREEIAERKAFHYPPFTRLINIFIKHKDQKITEQAAQQLAGNLRKILGDRVLGPDKPIIERIQTLYIQKIVVKTEVTASTEKAKEILSSQRLEILKMPEFKSTYIYFDVDPM